MIKRILVITLLLSFIILNSVIAYYSMLNVFMPNKDSAYLLQIVEVKQDGNILITDSWLWYR